VLVLVFEVSRKTALCKQCPLTFRVYSILFMTAISLYFKVHQPYRLKKYQPEDISVCECYEDPVADEENCNRVADNCYLPANEILYNSIIEQGGNFTVNFSISGTVLELLMRYRPDVIQSFKKLATTGHVEFLGETYYHSLASLHSPAEFERQVLKHAELTTRLFGKAPVVFRNTELIYNNRIAEQVAALGFTGILCEGVESILKGRSANHLYGSPHQSNNSNAVGLLLRNSTLSDDIAFRFDDVNWSEHPLTAAKFAEWIHSHPAETEMINLFMDYETFGVYKKKDAGIFEFLGSLPSAVLKKEGFYFSTASALIRNSMPTGFYDSPQTISWDDNTGEVISWCNNVMQNNTLKKIYSIEKMVQQSDCRKSIDIWGRLQAADHFYYMAERTGKTEAAKYLNPFNTAREAFQNYTNLVTDFEISLIKKEVTQYKRYHVSKSLASTLF
jgi:alpha-amylase